MNTFLKNLFYQTNSNQKYSLVLLLLLPIIFILGNLTINLLFFFLSIIFIAELLKNKNFHFVKDPIFLLLIFFFITLLINLFFSSNPTNSSTRILKLILIIMSIFQIKNIFFNNEKKFENIILNFWSIIFVILIFDIIFELIFGFNTLGFKSYIPARIASFFNEELIVGSFFLGFGLIFFSHFIKNYKDKKILTFIILLLLITISLLIGERSNFLKFLFGISLISLIILRPKIKNIIITISLIATIIFSLIYFDKSTALKHRYFTFFLNKNDQKLNIQKFYKNSLYGAHQNAAYKIFQNYPLFGIGVKNFRLESSKLKYKNDEYHWTNNRWSTHPHQIHFEFLAETGLFGYLSFLIFISASLILSLKNYFKNKNYIQLSCIAYILTSLIPFVPSGSFFTTFSSGLFWINYAIMVSYNKNYN